MTEKPQLSKNQTPADRAEEIAAQTAGMVLAISRVATIGFRPAAGKPWTVEEFPPPEKKGNQHKSDENSATE